MKCAVCLFLIGRDDVYEADTVINGLAVCSEHGTDAKIFKGNLTEICDYYLNHR